MLDVSLPRQPAELDAVFFALSDQTRRGLLGRLRGVELTAGALADGFHVTRPAVSRHLRILREAHLVREQRRGRERVYTLTAEPLAGATTWLEDYRAFWSARLADLKSLIESLPDDPADALPGARAQARSDARSGTRSEAQPGVLAEARAEAPSEAQADAFSEAPAGARADDSPAAPAAIAASSLTPSPPPSSPRSSK